MTFLSKKMSIMIICLFATLFATTQATVTENIPYVTTEAKDTIISKIEGLKNFKFTPSRQENTLRSSLNLNDQNLLSPLAMENDVNVYNQLETIPFGSTIDLSFEVLGETFDLKFMELASNAQPIDIVLNGENDEVVKYKLPMTTYASSFTDKDGVKSTVVASIDPITGQVMTNIQRIGKPSITIQPFEFFEMAAQISPQKASLLSSVEKSEYVAYYDNLGSNLPSLGVDAPCGALSHNEDVNTQPIQSEITDDSATSRSLQSLHRFRQCDFVKHGLESLYIFNTAINIDYSSYIFYGKSKSNLMAFLQNVFALNSLVYETQFRIRWKVRDITVETTTSLPTSAKGWNASKGACPDMKTQLETYQRWASQQPHSGSHQLYTICDTNPFGVIGIAYVKSLCSSSSHSVSKLYPWSAVNTIAHEVGHNFGSEHAWEYFKNKGQGDVGGIMDYGTEGFLLRDDATSPREYGFHQSSADPICNHLIDLLSSPSTTIGNAYTSCFSLPTPTAVCGNGIVEPGEECEVGGSDPYSLVSSNCCQNCKIAPNATCLTESDCCKNCQVAGSDKSCSVEGYNGFCGIGVGGDTCAYKTQSCSNVSYDPDRSPCAAFCSDGKVYGMPVGSLCKTKPSSSSPFDGVCVLSKNDKRTIACENTPYYWSVVQQDGCNCAVDAESDVINPYQLVCKRTGIDKVVGSNNCADAKKPVDKELTCKHYCQKSNANIYQNVALMTVLVSIASIAAIVF